MTGSIQLRSRADNEDGTYTFDLTARVRGATTYAGETLFNDAPSNANLVPDFVRTASTTAVVSGVPDFVVATVEYGPETINLKSSGKLVTAYIELPAGYGPRDIVLNSVAITAIDGGDIIPIKAERTPTAIGDFDTDGVPDLMVKFSRSALQRVLTAGMHEIHLQGLLVSGEHFVGERSVGVITSGSTTTVSAAGAAPVEDGSFLFLPLLAGE